MNVGAHQHSILDPLLFLVYINDLSTGSSSNHRLSADNTSLTELVRDRNTSANDLL